MARVLHSIFFKKIGWDITGLDFSNYGCKTFNPGCLENFIEGDIYQNIETIISSDYTYDVLWLDNVLEHVLEPMKLLKDLKNITSDESVLIIEVPNDFSIIQKYLYENSILKEKNWIVVPDHISYFNAKGLNALCKACGWNNIGLLSDFPIDWFLFNDHSNYYKDRSKGKAAHQARVTIENLLHEHSQHQINDLYEALANVNMGRQLIGFYRNSN